MFCGAVCAGYTAIAHTHFLPTLSTFNITLTHFNISSPGGRTLRSDYADPTRNKKNSPTASTQSTRGAGGEESASAWKQGFKKSSDIPGKVEGAPASPAKSVIPAPAPASVSVSVSGSVRTSSTVTGKDREKVTEREKESVTSQGSGSIIGLVSPERRLLRAEVNKEKERETAINRDRSFDGGNESVMSILQLFFSAERALCVLILMPCNDFSHTSHECSF